MLQNGPQRPGYTPIVGAQSSNVIWRYPTETNYGGAVVGRDGTIYVGTLLGQFLAFNPDGSIKWTVSTYPYTVESTPAILPDGRIAFVDSNGALLVVNPDGSRSWVFRTGVGCFCAETSPVVGRDGSIYFATGGVLYAINPDGSTRWTYDAGYTITGAPALGPNGIVYLPAGFLYAVDPSGSLLWTAPVDGAAGTPSIGRNGIIYVNTFVPRLYAVRPDGSIKWRFRLTGGTAADVPSSPAVAPDGTIYVGEELWSGQPDGVVVALNPNGTLKVGGSLWRFADRRLSGWGRHDLLRVGVPRAVQRLCPEPRRHAEVGIRRLHRRLRTHPAGRRKGPADLCG